MKAVIYPTIAASKVVQRDTIGLDALQDGGIREFTSREASQQHYQHHIHILDNVNINSDLWEAAIHTKIHGR
jgi:hypothetical protein